MTNEQFNSVLENLKERVVSIYYDFNTACEALDDDIYRKNIDYIDDILDSFDDALFAARMFMEALDEDVD